LSAGDIAAANSICPKVGKEVVKEAVKDVVKDGLRDTRKELIKDIRFDTRKELISDTRKEMSKDRIKEAAFDPPWGKRVGSDPIGPGTRPVLPGWPGGGARPFAVATAHQAPAAAAEPAQLEDAAAQLDAQLQALAEQILEIDATRDALQAQYDETAALLTQTMEEHDQATSS
jgi:hypothetical protein